MKYMYDDNDNIVITMSAKELACYPDLYCALIFPNVVKLVSLTAELYKITKQGSASPVPIAPTAREDS